MKRLSILLIAVLTTACSTSNVPDVQPASEGRDSRGGYDRAPMSRGAGGSLDLLPPDRWWQNDKIASALKLTSDQITALEKVVTDHADEIIRLQSNVSVATRELRDVLDREQVSADEIVQAAQHLRSLRMGILDQQLQMLGAERAILSRQQWQTLAERVQEMRREMRGGRGGSPGGGYPGGGRGPGWGG